MFLRQIGEMMIGTNFLMGILIGFVLFFMFKIVNNGAFNMVKVAKKIFKTNLEKEREELEMLLFEGNIDQEQVERREKQLLKMSNYYSKKEKQISLIQKSFKPLLFLFALALLIKISSFEMIQNFYFWLVDFSVAVVGFSLFMATLLTLVLVLVSFKIAKNHQKN